MKRKRNRNTRRAIQAIVLGSTAATNAAVIQTNPAGVITDITGLDSGANTVQAVAPVGFVAPFTVNVQPGAALSGDAGGDTISVVDLGFTINNAGNISSAANGVNVLATSAVVNNDGTILGTTNGVLAAGDVILDNTNVVLATGGAGVNATGIADVVNSGSIVGSTDGIVGLGGVFLDNTGSVVGGSGAGVTGSNVDVTNDGSINGVTSGVNATGTLILDNFGSIVSSAGTGVVATGNADVINDGSIIGLESGIAAGAELILDNTGSIVATGGAAVVSTGNADVINDGTIVGTTSGIVADANLILTNTGSITGGSADGVNVIGVADIDNGGSITGAVNGVVLGAGPGNIVTNSGNITGIAGVGVFGGAGDDFLESIGGSITGATAAIDLGTGLDDIDLSGGAVVNGAIVGTSDTFLNFHGDAEVHGNVDVGFISQDGPGTAFLGTVGESFDTTVNSTDVVGVEITGGALYFNGTLTVNAEGGGDVVVSNGELGGQGTLTAANVFLGAGGGISAGGTPIALASDPLDAIGTLDIDGNVFHDAGSYITHEATPLLDSGFFSEDTINHTGGVYDLGTSTTVRISPTSLSSVLQDGEYFVVNSSSVIEGELPNVAVLINGEAREDTVLGEFFTTPSIIDNGEAGTSLVLDIEHDYSALPGLSSGQSNFGEAIDENITNEDPEVQAFIAALDYSNLDTVQSVLAVPENYLGLTTVVINSNYRLHRMVQEHLAAIRAGHEVVTTAPITDSKGGKGGMVTSAPTSFCGRGNVWGGLSYDWQDYDGDSSPDFDGETGAITVGADWCVGNDFVLGVVLDGSTSDFDSDFGGGSDVDSFRVAAYGTWGQSLGLYSDFLLGYGTHDLDQDSQNLLGFGRLSGSTEADSFQALWTFGYAWGDRGFRHGPFAGLEYQNVDADDIDVSGPIPLDIDGSDIDSLRGLIGYRFNADYGVWRPYASIAYAHEFEDDEVDASASFAGTSFDVNGPELGSAVLITAGTGFSINDRLTLDVGYRGEIAVDDAGVTSHGATVGLNWCF